MRATKYIVIGRYDSEQNSWIPDGDIRHVVSAHRTLPGAARAADHAHYDLGGCDGSNALTQVMRRMDEAEPKPDPYDDTYPYAGRTYIQVTWFETHEIVPCPGGLGLKVRES